MFLRLFGPPTLLASDLPGAAVLLPPGKPAAVLAYLVRSRTRSATREALLDLLWSEAEPERARQSLRQALTQIRRVLGADSLEPVGELVRLRLALPSDVARFEAALDAGRAEDALRWADAPFLGEFATPGGAEFERWAAAERHRLAVAIQQAREGTARRLLEAGRFQDARRQARLARDGAVDVESAWTLLLETALAADDRLGAGMEAAALQRWIDEQDREPAPSTRRLLARARRLVSESDASAVGGEGARGEPTDSPSRAIVALELVGREREFARLLGAWAEARGNGFVHARVTGPAGIGKSRLVADVRHRLRAAGAPVPCVRANPGARSAVGILIADIAVALAKLPGALAIPPACATALVELAPALAGTYHAASADRSEIRPDGERAWFLALEQLLLSVSEERALALVVEDVHWADALSARVIGGLIERLRARTDACRVLMITTSRESAPRAERIDDGAIALEMALGPLTRADVEVIVRSIAPLPDAAWSSELLETLTLAARGVPLLVLELLALLVERGLVAFDADGWTLASAPDALDSLSALLLAHAGPGVRVTGLAHAEREVLELLALAGVPVDSASVTTGAARDGATDPEAALQRLAERGLVRHTELGEWEPVHDEIRDAALAQMTPDRRRALGRSLAEQLLEQQAVGPDLAGRRLLRAASMFVLADADDRLSTVYARWRTLRRAAGDGRSDRELAQALLGDASSPARLDALLVSRPMAVRLATSLGQRATAAVLALVLLGGFGTGLATTRATAAAPVVQRPARLAFVTRPIGWLTGMPMTPAPIVEVQDAAGDPVVGAGDSVRVEVIGDGAIVASPSAAAVQHGRATFDQVQLASGPRSNTNIRARFTYPGVAPLEIGIVSSEGINDVAARLLLTDGMVGDEAITPSRRVVHARAGSPITFALNLQYTSPWPAANVVMGAAPSWGDPAKSWLRLASLVTPARDFRLHSRFVLTAPRVPGVYHVVIAFGAEENAAYLLSGTNWSVGRPVWRDGNDVAAWDDAQRAEADSTGAAPSRFLRIAEGGPTSGIATTDAARRVAFIPARVAGTTLTLEVGP